MKNYPLPISMARSVATSAGLEGFCVRFSSMSAMRLLRVILGLAYTVQAPSHKDKLNKYIILMSENNHSVVSSEDYRHCLQIQKVKWLPGKLYFFFMID